MKVTTRRKTENKRLFLRVLNFQNLLKFPAMKLQRLLKFPAMKLQRLLKFPALKLQRLLKFPVMKIQKFPAMKLQRLRSPINLEPMKQVCLKFLRLAVLETMRQMYLQTI